MAMTKEKSEIVKFKSCFSFIGQTAPKSRITNAELTVAQSLIREPSAIGLYSMAGPFLVTFWASKK